MNNDNLDLIKKTLLFVRASVFTICICIDSVASVQTQKDYTENDNNTGIL